MQTAHPYRAVLATILLGLPTLACVNAVRVNEEISDGKYRQTPGIPFHTKVQLPQRSTVYSRSWLSVTLRDERVLVTVVDGKVLEKVIDSQAYTRSVSPENAAALGRVEGFIAQRNEQKALEAFLELPQLPDGVFKLTENSLTPVEQVDSRTTYYVNAPLPWVGSSEFTPEFAADGTLTKLEVNLDNQIDDLFGSIADAVTDLTTKEKPAPAESITDSGPSMTDDSNQPVEIRRLTFTTRKATEQKRYSRIYASGDFVPETLSDSNYDSYHSEIVWANDGAKAESKPKSPSTPTNTISFSGAVSLPTPPKEAK